MWQGLGLHLENLRRDFGKRLVVRHVGRNGVSAATSRQGSQTMAKHRNSTTR